MLDSNSTKLTCAVDQIIEIEIEENQDDGIYAQTIFAKVCSVNVLTTSVYIWFAHLSVLGDYIENTTRCACLRCEELSIPVHIVCDKDDYWTEARGRIVKM